MFKEVTSIEEALQRKFPDVSPFYPSQDLRTGADMYVVWNQIIQEKRAKQVAEENKIEMEDDQGNVMSEKTYNDLKAQGII